MDSLLQQMGAETPATIVIRTHGQAVVQKVRDKGFAVSHQNGIFIVLDKESRTDV